MRSSACDTVPRYCARPVPLLTHIPLGPRPWLHQLRSRLPGFVRWLHSYYGGVRLLMIVHHRLRLLAFPDAGQCSTHAGAWPTMRSPGSRAKSVRTCQCLRPRRAVWALALSRPSVLAFRHRNDVGNPGRHLLVLSISQFDPKATSGDPLNISSGPAQRLPDVETRRLWPHITTRRSRTRGLAAADPFVIAVAKIGGAGWTVVADEHPGSSDNRKIPFVCNAPAGKSGAVVAIAWIPGFSS